MTLSPAGARPASSITRRVVETAALVLVGLLVFRAVGVEPYGVPTGSMAPTLWGHHRSVTCPRCGTLVRVGVREGLAGTPYTTCPNCGCDRLDLANAPLRRGDHLLVNKTVFDLRAPRRWEIAVFRCPAEFGKAFVKRVIGLPGERMHLHDGDVYADYQIARKSLADIRTVACLPVFDLGHPPHPWGWTPRFVAEPDHANHGMDDGRIRLDGRHHADGAFDRLFYRNWKFDEQKEQAVRDEWSYNGSESDRLAIPVHDFYLTGEVEATGGDGWIGLALTDGADVFTLELPVGPVGDGVRLTEGWPSSEARTASDSEGRRVFRVVPGRRLRRDRKYQLEFAFVDRRLTAALDGRELFEPLDLPAVDVRAEVSRPFALAASGLVLFAGDLLLRRDVHYTDVGRHGTRIPFRLGAGEYFMLGDNSANSDDGRFWSAPDGGPLPVRRGDFLGKPFLVQLPGARPRADAADRNAPGFPWGQIRWLR